MTTETSLDAEPDFAMDIGQTAELIAQLLKRTGGKLSQTDIAEAIASVGDLYVSAATLQMWKTGRIEFGWDTEAEELVLIDANQLEAGEDDERIILGERP